MHVIESFWFLRVDSNRQFCHALSVLCCFLVVALVFDRFPGCFDFRVSGAATLQGVHWVAFAAAQRWAERWLVVLRGIWECGDLQNQELIPGARNHIVCW